MVRIIYSLTNEFPPVIIKAEDMGMDTVMKLWAGVMKQAMFDASYGLQRYYKKGKLNYRIDKKTWSPHVNLIKYCRGAQQWFLDGDEDFIEVCGILSLDPENLQTYAVGMFKEINTHVPFQWKIKRGPFKLI